MKKFLKILGAIVALLVLYCAIAMAFFDSHYHGEQSVTINAPAEKIWQNVNSMKAINSWNPWMKLDPNLKGTYSGNSGEIGDFYHWKGNDDVGEGEQKISKIVPHEKVETEIHFIKPFESKAVSNVLLMSKETGTKVTWTMDFECDLMMKPMKPFMNWKMNKSFSEGLNNLKVLAEK